MPAKEIDFQQDLCFLLRAVIDSHPEIKGTRFEAARMEFDVDHGHADIAITRPGGHPLVLIETKRKNGRIQRDIDPLSPAVIAQALSYAVQSGSPYFATANPDYLAVFRVPEPGEQFRIERHRVLVTAIPALSDEFGLAFLEKVVEYDNASSDPDRARLATSLDWTFVVRIRSFVDWLTRRAEPAVAKSLEGDTKLRNQVTKFEKETGTKFNASDLARQMAYILANKIVFHKALERNYPKIKKLSVRGVHGVQDILRQLNATWKAAAEVTKDFEAIFFAGLYDEIDLSDVQYDLLDIAEGIQGFIEDMETYRLEDLGADILGHVYEALIPDEERHRLGQFYTPPAIAEFLVRWAIRSPDDIVLDPGAGSGTFLVKAYERLRDLKKETGVRMHERETHREILSQLYAIDINPFPGHLTAMNLAMRDVAHPVTEMNILERDFFSVTPGAPAYVSYVVRGPQRESKREIIVPLCDVVVGNPPYTRWLEIPDATREAINRRLGADLSKYNLTAVVRAGVETAIYQHFVLHGHAFLREGGRLAMIVSNSWLQTDVGVSFANYLQDHFRIHAVVDLGPRIFPIPLIATCLILLERCESQAKRGSTKTMFAYVNERVSVDDLADLLRRPERYKERFQLEVIQQGKLPAGQKWIGNLFGFPILAERVRALTVPVGELYEITKGTIGYCAEKKRGLGANRFFFVTEDTVRDWGLEKFTHPCLSRSTWLSNYTFGRGDWTAVQKKGKIVFLFSCRLPSRKLPRQVYEYVRWGETRCQNRDGILCAESQSCAERADDSDHYAGWYDVGDVQKADILAPYYAQYRHRFVQLTMKIATDHDFLAFASRKRLDPDQHKAVLATLNSSLGQAFIEAAARTTGGGMASLEFDTALNLPIPDVRKMSKGRIHELVSAFDALEKASRSSGGAQTRGAETKLKKEYDDLDSIVAHELGLTAQEMQRLRHTWTTLAERRLARAAEPSPETLQGKEKTFEHPPKKARSRDHGAKLVRRLDEFEM